MSSSKCHWEAPPFATLRKSFSEWSFDSAHYRIAQIRTWTCSKRLPALSPLWTMPVVTQSDFQLMDSELLRILSDSPWRPSANRVHQTIWPIWIPALIHDYADTFPNWFSVRPSRWFQAILGDSMWLIINKPNPNSLLGSLFAIRIRH